MGAVLDQFSETYIIPATIMIYEYLVTFDREVADIWKRRRFIPACFFIISRYGGFLYVASQCMKVWCVESETIPPVCNVGEWNILALIIGILELIIIINATAFSCLRIWAILGRRYRHLLWLAPLALFPVVVSVLQIVGLTGVWWIVMYPLACPIALLVWDIVVLVSTLSQTLSIRRQLRGKAESPTIVVMLVRDGSWYFLMTAISQAITFPVLDGNQMFYIVDTNTTLASANGMMTSVRFRSIRAIGNIGAPFSMATNGTYVDDEELEQQLIQVGEHQYLENPLSIGLVMNDSEGSVTTNDV
ncbi:hypothetical protein C8Q75DRAFT_812197 [Abortiporus biennis]|nr:hypothetical protein C8Q75DRAFT_812197 [Abortiporus biennis]